MSPLVDMAKERARWVAGDRSESAAWDARRVATDLRKAGHLAEAVDFCEAAAEHWPDFEPLRSAHAWALYSRDVAGLDDQSTQEARALAKASVDLIAGLTTANPYGQFSAWPMSVLKLAQVLAERWPATSLEVALRLAADQLSTEKSGDFSSLRARWHSVVTKALKDLEKWPELFEACNVALAEDCYKAGERRWIARRRGLALMQLGEFDAAFQQLEAVRSEIKEWYLDAELGYVLAELGRDEEAIDACRRALLAPGDRSSRWRPAALLGQLLQDVDPDLAAQHVQLARNLRHASGWPAEPALEDLAVSMSLPSEAPAKVDLTPLLASWESAGPAREPGVVKRLVSEGSGFIEREGQPDLYFSMGKGKTAPAEGTQVTFVVVDGFDSKKQVPSQQARDVRIAT